jgi:hypothetical protein
MSQKHVPKIWYIMEIRGKTFKIHGLVESNFGAIG